MIEAETQIFSQLENFLDNPDFQEAQYKDSAILKCLTAEASLDEVQQTQIQQYLKTLFLVQRYFQLSFFESSDNPFQALQIVKQALEQIAQNNPSDAYTSMQTYLFFVIEEWENYFLSKGNYVIPKRKIKKNHVNHALNHTVLRPESRSQDTHVLEQYCNFLPLEAPTHQLKKYFYEQGSKRTLLSVLKSFLNTIPHKSHFRKYINGLIKIEKKRVQKIEQYHRQKRLEKERIRLQEMQEPKLQPEGIQLVKNEKPVVENRQSPQQSKFGQTAKDYQNLFQSAPFGINTNYFRPILPIVYDDYQSKRVVQGTPITMEAPEPQSEMDLQLAFQKTKEEKAELQERSKVVLDTNMVYNDLLDYLITAKYDVIIPAPVLEEIEKHKHDHLRPQVQFNSRKAARILLSALAFDLWEVEDHSEFSSSKKDYDFAIIEAAKRTNATLVSMDNIACLRAQSQGVQIHNPDRYNKGILYKKKYEGYIEMSLRETSFHKISEQLYVNTFKELGLSGDAKVNQYVVLYNNKNYDERVIFRHNTDNRYIQVNKTFQPLINSGVNLRPMDDNQAMALDLMLQPDVPINVIDGTYGTGKTLLAMAIAIASCYSINPYMHYYVTRPPITHDRKLGVGFLPGNIDAKLSPWLQGVSNSIEALVKQKYPTPDEILPTPDETNIENYIQHSHQKRMLHDIWSTGIQNQTKSIFKKFEVKNLESIQGASLNHTLIILDEAQLVSSSTMEQIISRIGNDSKLIILGDWGQSYDLLHQSESGYLKLLQAIPRINNPQIGMVHLRNIYRGAGAELAHAIFKS